ncbi:MAG: cadherin-like domain-containing protein, partial [Prochlorococcus sp.]
EAGTEDTTYTLNAAQLLQGYSDIDGDALSIANLATTNGSISNNENGTYSFSPDANLNGTVSLNYTISDGNGGSLGAQNSFSLKAVNDAPTLSATPATLSAGREDNTYTLTASHLLQGFSDIDGDALSIISLAATNGSISDNENGTYLFAPNANFNGKVSLSYTISDGNGGFVIAQNSFSLAVAIDSDPPELVSAEVSDNELTIGFNEAINQDTLSLPGPSSFKVSVNGIKATVTEVSEGPSLGSISLRLKNNVAFADKVSLDYGDLKFDQSINLIQDLAGNDLITLTNIAVDNHSFDSSDLALASSFVDGSRLEVNFDREIATTIPSNRLFRVEVDGKRNNVAAAEVFPDDMQVVLQLQRAVTDSQAVTISYSDPKGNQRKNIIEDIQGNDLISFTKHPVGNDTIDRNPLTLDEGEVIDAGKIHLYFNKTLNNSEPTTSQFKVFVNKKRKIATSIEMSPSEGQLILNMKENIPVGAEIHLNYKALIGDKSNKTIKDKSNNELTSFKGFIIDNFLIDSEAPTIDDAVFNNKKLITLYFDEEVATSKVKGSRFKVTIDGKRTKISNINVPAKDTIVNLTLRKKANPDSDVLISYKDPKRDQKQGVIEDLAGNDVKTFSNFQAEHIYGDNAPLLRSSDSDDTFSPLTNLEATEAAENRFLV